MVEQNIITIGQDNNIFTKLKGIVNNFNYPFFMEKITIRIDEERELSINLSEFQKEIDIDSLLKIDYSLIQAEIAVFPAITNRFGILLAELENRLSEDKLNLDIQEAKFKEKTRNTPSGRLDAKGNDKGWTNDEVNEQWHSSVLYKTFKKKMINTQKERDYFNSIYWACKDKSDKLNAISKTLDFSDGFDERQIEKGIHNIMMKIRKPLIK